MNLLDETKYMLVQYVNKEKVSIASLAGSAGVQAKWLGNLYKGLERGYDVTMVQRVHDYLSKQESKP